MEMSECHVGDTVIGLSGFVYRVVARTGDKVILSSTGRGGGIDGADSLIAHFGREAIREFIKGEPD